MKWSGGLLVFWSCIDVIVVRLKVSRGIEPFSPMGIDAADTSPPPNVEICMDKSQLLSNNPTRQQYRYTSVPIEADNFFFVSGASQLDGAILVVGATDGCMPQTREHLTLTKQLGLKHLVVYINKCDAADAEMIELVEMEIRELLEEMGFSEENSPIVKGSALAALEGTNPELGEKSILELMKTVDESIPTPVRQLDVPFLMPIDHVHNIQGRGCVITGRLERGKLKVSPSGSAL